MPLLTKFRNDLIITVPKSTTQHYNRWNIRRFTYPNY